VLDPSTVITGGSGIADVSAINDGAPRFLYIDNVGVIHPNGMASAVGHAIIRRDTKGAPLKLHAKWYCDEMQARSADLDLVPGVLLVARWDRGQVAAPSGASLLGHPRASRHLDRPPLLGHESASAAGRCAREGRMKGLDMTRETAAFVCSHVFNRSRPILLVAREAGDWMYLCGQAHGEDEQYHVIGAGHLLERDSTLSAVTDLPENMEAERPSVTAPWAATRAHARIAHRS